MRIRAILTQKKRLLCTAALIGLSACLVVSPAAAQGISADDATALRAQVELLRAQLAALEARVNAQTVAPAPTAPVTTPSPAPVASPAATTTEWRGAPEMRTASGWSFKPRGRMQLDAGTVSAPAAITDTGLGFSNEFRRVYLGVDGTMPGGIGYRVEADFADNTVQLTDVYLTYGRGPVAVTIGQQKPFQSMEDMTSDLFTSFTERAAFNSAFGFERRVGISATYSHGALIAQGGLFSDDVSALTNAANNSWSADGRLAFAPMVGTTQLHLGASAHSRTFNDAAASTRYRARPFIHSTDTRFVDTGAILASGETGYGLEAAAVHGRFHAVGEASWMTVRRPGLVDPTFFGGYAEAGLFLTNDHRVLRKGAFDRVRPSRNLTNGGMGAVELNLRYDWLNLNDSAAAITGGQQATYGASLTWIPTDYVRFILNYGHVVVDDARIAAGTDRNYALDALGLRAQIDF